MIGLSEVILGDGSGRVGLRAILVLAPVAAGRAHRSNLASYRTQSCRGNNEMDV